MKNLGYWSKPFILEDHYMDNHKMITYSVPLIYDNEIYGILGVEVSLPYLNTFFPTSDFDRGLNSGYALVMEKRMENLRWLREMEYYMTRLSENRNLKSGNIRRFPNYLR